MTRDNPLLIAATAAFVAFPIAFCIGYVEGTTRGSAYAYASIWQWTTPGPGNPEFRECVTAQDALREIRRRLPLEQVITGAELSGNKNIRLWDSRLGRVCAFRAWTTWWDDGTSTTEVW